MVKRNLAVGKVKAQFTFQSVSIGTRGKLLFRALEVRLWGCKTEG